MDKIQVKDLNLYYNKFQALKNINIAIKENKIMSFIGPSGCGKSTPVSYTHLTLPTICSV